MNLTTRTIEKTDSVLYIIPAIQLKPFVEEGKKRYGERVVHIGRFNGDRDKVACLCGQHHKQPDDAFEFLNVNSHPDITCGGCIRSLKALLNRSTGRPYEVIMKAIHQKIEDAEFHVKKEGSHSQSYGPYEVEPESRILEGSLSDPLPRLRPDGLIIEGVIDVFGNIMEPVIHAISSVSVHTGTKALCDKGCNLIKVDTENLSTFPSINCPECAKLIRERFPEDEPKAFVDHQDEIEFAQLQIDELADELQKLKEHMFALKASNMMVANVEELKKANVLKR